MCLFQRAWRNSSRGGYLTLRIPAIVNEYIRSLVRADEQRAAEEELESKLIAALDSGQ